MKFTLFCLITTLMVEYGSAFNKHEGSNVLSQSYSSTSNLYEICKGNNTSIESPGTLISPNYDSYYYGPAVCYFFIHAPIGFHFIDSYVNYFDSSPNNGYLRLSTSNVTLTTLKGGPYTDQRWGFVDNAEFYLYLSSSSYRVSFNITWKFGLTYNNPPPAASECEGPDILFLLDRSQAILPDFYNTTIKDFLRRVTYTYIFDDDVTILNPFSSRFGIIEFSDEATVTVPLNHYTRAEFFWQIQRNISYGNGGDSNVAAALTQAYKEFIANGTSSSNGSYHVPGMIALVVNDISRFHYDETLAAMDKLKTIITLPTGVIVPGLPGIPNGALERLINLTGNAKYAFGSLDDAQIGIPTLTNTTFTCPICGNLVFICEMTVAIGYDTKLLCLQLAQKLAMATADNMNKQYAIALYGVEIYHDIEFQSFDKFNDTINAMIENIQTNNLPNGGQTFLAPILNQLYKLLNKNDTTSKADIFTLIVGELSAIRDPSPANTAAQNVSRMYSDIYVLDQSRYGPPADIWSTLTGHRPNHIVNGTTTTDIDILFETFEATLLQDYNKLHC